VSGWHRADIFRCALAAAAPPRALDLESVISPILVNRIIRANFGITPFTLCPRCFCLLPMQMHVTLRVGRGPKRQKSYGGYGRGSCDRLHRRVDFYFVRLRRSLMPDTEEITAVSSVPLPAALPLFASGLAGLGLLGWRRKRKAQAAA
jgi:hypothetical protein